MLTDTSLKYSYNDIEIMPAQISYIKHRSECNPFYSNGNLPIFTAPMSTVVSEQNFHVFEDAHINPILPRNVDFEIRKKYILDGKWVALSMKEFSEFILGETLEQPQNIMHILIDVANGHMESLYEMCANAKKMYGDGIVLMVGNVANPETYRIACRAKVDYLRLNIGGGSGCLTSSNTGVHYPIASLIAETVKVRENILQFMSYDDKQNAKMPKIVADASIRGYRDVNKALALGADYVMIGGLFAQAIESAGKKILHNPEKSELVSFNIEDWDNLQITESGEWHGDALGFQVPNGPMGTDTTWIGNNTIGQLDVVFYGMASANGQRDLYGKKIKTSEGKTKVMPVLYTIKQWSENMQDYLRSAMSYCNSETIEEFIKYSEAIVVSNNTFNSLNK